MAVYSDATTKLNNYLQTSQHRSYFLIFITLLFVIVMVIFGILPAYSSFTLQGAENAKRQEAITQLQTKLDALKNLTRESQADPKLIEYFHKIFPSSPDQDNILNEIIEIANKNAVYLVDLKYDENKELSKEFANLLIPLTPNVESLTLSLTIEGSQQTLINYIRDIEAKSRIYNIKNLNIVRKGEIELLQTTPDKYYTLLMNVNIYFYNENVQQPTL